MGKRKAPVSLAEEVREAISDALVRSGRLKKGGEERRYAKIAAETAVLVLAPYLSEGWYSKWVGRGAPPETCSCGEPSRAGMTHMQLGCWTDQVSPAHHSSTGDEG